MKISKKILRGKYGKCQNFWDYLWCGDEARIAHTVNESKLDHMQNNNNLNLSRIGNLGFVRKSEVGGWVDDMNGEQSAYFEKPIQRVTKAGGQFRCNL